MRCNEHRIFIATVYTFSAVSCTALTFKFIKSVESKRASDKCLFYLALLYFCIIILNYIIWATLYPLFCALPDIGSKFSFIGITFTMLQYTALMIFLFYRLCTVFKGTQYAVSTQTVYTFYCIFTISSCLAVYGIILGISSPSGSALITIASVLAIVVVTYLIISFVMRLVMYSKHINDRQMVLFAVKVLLLTILSILSVILMIAAQIVCHILCGRYGNSTTQQMTRSMLYASGPFVNFISVIFGFDQFEKYYMLLCRVCDRRCVQWIGDDNEGMLYIRTEQESTLQISDGHRSDMRSVELDEIRDKTYTESASSSVQNSDDIPRLIRDVSKLQTNPFSS